MNRCSTTSIYKWSLARIRTTVIHLLPNDKITQALCDVAIGPAALLIGIRETMEDFHYIGTVYETMLLNKVDIYERHVLSDERRFIFIITLKVRNQGERNDLKINKNLAEVSQFTQHKVDILSVKVCKISNSVAQSRGTTGNKEEYYCDFGELQLKANFHVIGPLVGDNLIGQKFTRDRGYDYDQDPFTQPIGVGCWIDDLGLSGQKKFSIDKRQFSAEFEATNGSGGLSFVAYDGYSGLLRLDRNGRKGIYDIARAQSYHIDEFSAVKEITSSSDITKDCIVLAAVQELLQGMDPIERLIGLRSNSQTSAIYLGSKTIDHKYYGVYEIELKYRGNSGPAYNLPILLEPVLYKLPTVNTEPTKRFYITYYVEEYLMKSDIVEDSGGAGNGPNDAAANSMMVPKYIELWEYNVSDGKRELINRLEFIQFSWSLDVKPSDDSDSHNSNYYLFNIESCAKERSDQLELRHRIGPDSESRSFDKELMVAAFKSYPELIKELLHEKLAHLLDISRLNIVQLDVTWMQQSPKLLIEAKIVELINGMGNDKLLGYGNYNEAFKSLGDYIIAYHYGRHTLHSCQLDSLTERDKNSLMYCKSLALCVLIKSEAVDDYIVKLDHPPNGYDDHSPSDTEQSKSHETPLSVFSLPGEETNARCEFHQFSWIGRPLNEQESIVSRVIDNKYRLSTSQFDISFKLFVPPNWQIVRYVGINYGPEIKRLDLIGGGGGGGDLSFNNKWPLGSLRHTIASENPIGTFAIRNFNIVIRVPKNRKDNLKYCQLACQMDAYCESFSICSRSKKSTPVDQMFDCILSTFRITSESIEQLRNLSIGKTSSGSMEIRRGSLNYLFKFDPKCNIHPKDILSLYKVKETYEDDEYMSNNDSQSANDDKSVEGAVPTSESPIFTIVDSPVNQEQEQQKQKTTSSVVTLEECAEISHNNSLERRKVGSSFLYCPLESLCFPNKGDNENEQQLRKLKPNNQLCHLYSASHTQFYHYTPFARLSIDKNSHPATQNVDSQPSSENRAMALKRMKEWYTVSRFFTDHSLDRCSQFCDLHQTSCLSFDHCKLAGNNQLCLIYSIRSPFSKINKRLPLLKTEEPYYLDGANRTAKLISDLHCTHYHPKEIFFEIKLEQMQPVMVHNGGIDPEQFDQRNETNKAEDLIINENQEKSDKKLEEKIEQLGIDPNSDISNITIKPPPNHQPKESDGGSGSGIWLNLFLIFLGAIVGTASVTYGNVVIIYLSDRWETLKARRFGRNAEHRLSQLALSNNQHL